MQSRYIWRPAQVGSRIHAFTDSTTFGAPDQIGARCNYRYQMGLNISLPESDRCLTCSRLVAAEELQEKPNTPT